MGSWLSFYGLPFYSFLLHDLIVIILVPIVLLRRQDPAVTIAWIFAVLTLPFLGALMYLLFGNSQMGRRAHRRRQRQRQRQARYRQHHARIPDIASATPSPVDILGQMQLYKLLARICPSPATAGNDAEIMTNMRINYEKQLEAIAQAKDHVHVEYYIFQPDPIGERFREELVAAARRGVEVRFLYDAIGSMWLTRAFLKEMEKAGVETAAFIPLNPFSRRWIFNFRNHRKIVVVDGKVAFLGGANIGEEYLGLSNYGVWGDLHVRLTGPAVVQLQKVFAEDWTFASGKDLEGSRYFPDTHPVGNIVAQVVPGGPDMPVPVYHELYFSAVSNAVEQIRITTPYFVPSEAVLVALQTAARRGVDVQVLVPGRSTKGFVQLAARSFYKDLLDAGAKIYEYRRGFMHSKVLTVDGRWSIVGTANFDNRSMKLNFEIGVAFYSSELTEHLDRLFDENVKQSEQILTRDWKNRTVPLRLLENCAALFSPIL